MTSPNGSIPKTRPRPRIDRSPSPEHPATAVCPDSANSAPVTPRVGRGRHRHPDEPDTGVFPRLAADRDADGRAVPVPVQEPERSARLEVFPEVRLRGPDGLRDRAELVLRTREYPCCRRVRLVLAAIVTAGAIGIGTGLVLVAAVTAPDWIALIRSVL